MRQPMEVRLMVLDKPAATRWIKPGFHHNVWS